MTVSYSPTSKGQLTFTSIGASDGIPSDTVFAPGLNGVIYNFSLMPNTAWTYPVQLTSTVNALSVADTFVVQINSDPDLYSALPTGVIPLMNVPPQYFSLGTSGVIELARKVVSANGSVTFDLDLQLLHQFMSTSLQYAGGWNGTLNLWFFAIGTSFSTWTVPTLSAYSVSDYANRDTGRSGAPRGSRVSRCPVTGLAISRQLMVKDGYRDIYVHPMAWDPAEPVDPEFHDYPDPNEDG